MSPALSRGRALLRIAARLPLFDGCAPHRPGPTRPVPSIRDPDEAEMREAVAAVFRSMTMAR
jgi:hypothetical protein